MLITILTCFAIVALAEIIAYVSALAQQQREAEEKERAREAEIRRIEAEIQREAEAEARRSELLETLSAAYKKAKGRGVHNFYLLALSHCCQLLRMGEDIDEGAALLALQGIEGDARLDSMVQAILRPEAGE